MSPEILKKFFNGKATADEVHQVLIWINSPEGQQELEEKFDQYQEEFHLEDATSQKLKEEIFEKIGEPEDSNKLSEPIWETKKKSKTFSKSSKPIGLKIAIAACFSLCLLWLFSIKKDTLQNQIDPKNTTEVVNYVERTVSKGQKLTIKLGDGSEVQLNSESSIRFPEKFSSSERNVYLEGEAFFNVKSDSSRPFIVHTKSLQTRVLGTSFTVKEVEGNSEGMVAVLTGKVEVSVQNAAAGFEVRKVALEPMDAASIDFSSKSLQKIRIEYDDVFAWKDNIISFKNATFQQVSETLQNWYGVEFKVSSNFNSKQDYTGKFKDQSLEEVLLGLSFIYDFDFQIKDNLVFISKN